ncbi:Vitamin B12 import ATP-binding protein BtuD [bioreactor metagenome]|uniref:Vitamin B12 import ATP-binding protein BtuD n=1 Tax=bioreactor metagenome TaxID=1076179 RepID=A0A645GQR0_9ZZZZ
MLELDLNKKIEDMSLGNKKKVGIVQGLLHEPRLIILDEPTSGLDPLMQRTFFDLIQRENKRGATVLFSSHILGEVQRICDRVAIIKEGRIVNTQKIADLRKNTYKKVRFTAGQPLQGFALPGPTGLQLDGAQASFMYSGDCNVLMAALAALPLQDVDVTEPDLEEIFMHYYTEQEAEHERLPV